MTERIDAHHHLWRYQIEDYGWISDTMSVLKQDFLPADLEKEIHAAGIDGTVAVQARQTLAETDWLLSLAAQASFIHGVVGWAPISSSDFSTHLDLLRRQPKLKGLRHVVQDEPDPKFLQGPDFNRGISLLAGTGLIYDILIFERQLPSAIEFVDAHPKQVFVLDHIAKPRISEAALDPWRKNISELAKRKNVYCKLSGMVTEADHAHWTKENLRPYFDVVLEAFGPHRIMAGSDWPVCLLAVTYAKWFETVKEFIEPLSAAEKDMILGGTATQAYHLHG
ncbi:MAG: amidohydrolase family protein [Candidatus Acidiferrum sp.]